MLLQNTVNYVIYNLTSMAQVIEQLVIYFFAIAFVQLFLIAKYNVSFACCLFI